MFLKRELPSVLGGNSLLCFFSDSAAALAARLFLANSPEAVLCYRLSKRASTFPLSFCSSIRAAFRLTFFAFPKAARKADS